MAAPVISKVAVASKEVTVALQGAEDSSALIVLAHGAGADMSSDFMEVVSRGLVEEGLAVARFNFPYAEAGRRAPDKAEMLEATWSAVLDRLGSQTEARHVIVGGKSMGGRIASQVVAKGATAAALVFLGYPLHPPGKPERLRAAHLRDIGVPMIFIEGTRDPFCPLPMLEQVVRDLDAPASIHVIEGGDHSFRVRKASGRTTSEVWAEIPIVVARWVRSVLASGAP